MPEFVIIPKDRVGALVGKEGRTKAMLEKKGKVKLDISSDGNVSIVSPEEDGLREWSALEAVKAVGRGFNPKIAMNLYKEDYVLSIINLYEILKQKDSELKRIKSRIIGEGGKARNILERLTSTKIVVYGKTVSIIGLEADVELAERAIQMIIDGSRHPNVYKFLEREGAGRRLGL
jgi:ribosomal RNA assembly protein